VVSSIGNKINDAFAEKEIRNKRNKYFLKVIFRVLFSNINVLI